jgi:hypothetical protein
LVMLIWFPALFTTMMFLIVVPSMPKSPEI